VGKIRWEEVPEDRLNDQVTRKVFWGDNIMVTSWELAADVSFPVHQHESEQITMVQEGSVTLVFPGEQDVVLEAGDMLVIKSSRPHGVKVGSRGCRVIDLFSPIRKDFLERSEAYLSRSSGGTPKEEATAGPEQQKNAYSRLQGFLGTVGIHVELDKLELVPLEILARYCYEKQCITMGQLRTVLGLDKTQAKNLLRQWKHGDDHSESSLKRKMERMIVLPSELKLYGTS
jgi:quercetin dioxygenase-like cupin family protein